MIEKLKSESKKKCDSLSFRLSLLQEAVDIIGNTEQIEEELIKTPINVNADICLQKYEAKLRAKFNNKNFEKSCSSDLNLATDPEVYSGGQDTRNEELSRPIATSNSTGESTHNSEGCDIKKQVIENMSQFNGSSQKKDEKSNETDQNKTDTTIICADPNAEMLEECLQSQTRASIDNTDKDIIQQESKLESRKQLDSHKNQQKVVQVRRSGRRRSQRS